MNPPSHWFLIRHAHNFLRIAKSDSVARAAWLSMARRYLTLAAQLPNLPLP